MPREGHDFVQPFQRGRIGKFQSTCPARGTTLARLMEQYGISISIHVPREGHDDNQRNELYYFGYISIHVPREGHDM